jgi:hypothetical protein
MYFTISVTISLLKSFLTELKLVILYYAREIDTFFQKAV